jgi:3-dehydroquinate synthase
MAATAKPTRDLDAVTHATSAPETVRVDLGARSYDIMIGRDLLARAGAHIAEKLGDVRAAVVTDTNVARHHGAALEASLAGAHLGTIVLPAGEATKTPANAMDVTERLLAMGVERRDVVVALGGGVIGDLAGFAASIVRRGVRFVQIPTTLLAQVDSSVGGKTGVNASHGKNLIGAFHQPSLVLADTGTLATLPAREMRAGYAEVAKYGLLGDAAFFDWLERNADHVLAQVPAALTHAIRTSVAAKAAIVARDETETGERMLLNLGHTFGHALEAWAGYSDRLLHGEAIAIGMAEAFRYSAREGHLTDGSPDRVESHLRRAGLPTRIAHMRGNVRPTTDELLALMAQDKKVARGALTFVLARRIGDTYVARGVERARIAAFLDEECALMP